MAQAATGANVEHEVPPLPEVRVTDDPLCNMLLESKRVYVFRQWAEENRGVSRTWDVLGKLVEIHDGDNGKKTLFASSSNTGTSHQTLPQASRAKLRNAT